MPDILNLTIRKARKDIISKKYSISELIQNCLQNVDTYNPQINSILTLNKNAQSEAFKCDNLLSSDPTIYERKPLLGIPVVLKDNYLTKGITTTAGSSVLKDFVPQYDATSVRLLIDAGAIVIGKANLDAWAHGSSGENSDFGPTKNPYNLQKIPGGSSSGSAASLASGMCLFATGTDTGGSIRLPASFCNLVGIKPTYGRVSRYGIIAMGSSFDSIGHFTHDVYDSALVLSQTAGVDPFDATTIASNTKFIPVSQDNKPFTVGVIKEFKNTSGVHEDVKYVFEHSCKVLERTGCNIVEISIPHISYALSAYYILVMAEISSNLGRMDGIRFGNDRSHFGKEAIRRVLIGSYTLSSGYYDAYYKRALKVRRLIMDEFCVAFQKVDALISPVSAVPAFDIGDKINDPLAMYMTDIFTCPINIAGLPSITIPAGTAEGMPCGIQLVSDIAREDILFSLGMFFEDGRDKFTISHNLQT